MYPDRVRVARAHRHAARRPPPSRSPGEPSAAAPSRLDPRWRGGDYYDAEPGDGPHEGLAIARMVAQVTFRSDDVFTDRFGRELADGATADELRACGSASRSSATSTTTATSWSGASTPTATCVLGKAMDLHDVGRGRGGLGAGAWPASRCPRWSLGISSDMLYPTYQQRQIHRAAGPATARRRELRRDRLAPRPRRVPARPRPGRPSRSATFLDEVEKRDRPMSRRRPAPASRTPSPSAPAAPTTRRAARPRCCWATSTFGTPTASTRPGRMADRRRGPTASTAATRNPTVQRLRGGRRRARGRRGRPGLRLGHGRGGHGGARRCARRGDHIVAQRQIYSGTQLFLQGVCPRFGIDVTFVDGTEPGALAAAVRPGRTMLVLGRDAGQPAAGPDRPGRAGRHHRARSPWSTPPSPRRSCQQPARPRRRPRAALGHQGHRRPQRRHPRRRRRRRRAARRGVGLLGAARRVRLAVRRHERPAGHPHAARARRAARAPPRCALAEWLEAHPAVAGGPLPRPAVAPAARPGQAADGATAAGSCAVDLAGGLEAGRPFVEARAAGPAWPSSLGGPETLVTSPANSTHVGLQPTRSWRRPASAPG